METPQGLLILTTRQSETSLLSKVAMPLLSYSTDNLTAIHQFLFFPTNMQATVAHYDKTF